MIGNEPMTDVLHAVDSPAQIAEAAAALRSSVLSSELTPQDVMKVFEAWAKKLESVGVDDIPGIVFLRMWLRRGNLEPILLRELGANALEAGWTEAGRARLRAFPLGVVGHWPAGNVDIQPMLSMTCSLLGGNAALVRVPSDLVDATRWLIEKLNESDPEGVLTSRIFIASFKHSRNDLQEAMARSVDGAMIWGGEEAVTRIKALPFPHWARVSVFGPRVSVAALDAGAWTDAKERDAWCTRIARDVWQFDQQACSSPQVLFLEKYADHSAQDFLPFLQRAFELENCAHPRLQIAGSLTSSITQARAAWLLNGPARKAIFPSGPDWTILYGIGSDVPNPVQGRTLTVLEVDDLLDPIGKLDGNVQTLGLGIVDAEKEKRIASLAGRRGVDRIVKLGRMHVFVPPWDGMDLIRPMVRMVRYVRSTE